MLGTCTNSSVALGLDERRRPTENIDNDSAKPANGPASEMSTFVLRSGRMDLNCKTSESVTDERKFSGSSLSTSKI